MGSASRRARSRARTASRSRGGSPRARRASRAGARARGTAPRAPAPPRASSRRASASGPSGSSQRRSVTPTAFGPGAEQRDRAVDAAAHRDGDALGVGRGAEDLSERVRRARRPRALPADRRRLEQRQPGERLGRSRARRRRRSGRLPRRGGRAPTARRARSLRRPRPSAATVATRALPWWVLDLVRGSGNAIGTNTKEKGVRVRSLAGRAPTCQWQVLSAPGASARWSSLGGRRKPALFCRGAVSRRGLSPVDRQSSVQARGTAPADTGAAPTAVLLRSASGRCRCSAGRAGLRPAA